MGSLGGGGGSEWLSFQPANGTTCGTLTPTTATRPGVWARVDAAGQASGRPWQSWLVIQPAEPREDAVYLHTPNPNRDNFPYPFEDVVWGAKPPAWAAPAAGLEFGQSSYGGVELLWVRRPQDAEPSYVPAS